jgi:hypothetical protein
VKSFLGFLVACSVIAFGVAGLLVWVLFGFGWLR